VPCYRRPLSHMTDPIVRAGFTIERTVEPVPTEEFAEVKPEEYARLTRRPRVLCVRIRKPAHIGFALGVVTAMMLVALPFAAGLGPGTGSTLVRTLSPC